VATTSNSETLNPNQIVMKQD